MLLGLTWPGAEPESGRGSVEELCPHRLVTARLTPIIPTLGVIFMMVTAILDSASASLGGNLYLCLWLRSGHGLISRRQSLQLIILYRALNKVIHIPPSLILILESVDISE